MQNGIESPHAGQLFSSTTMSQYKQAIHTQQPSDSPEAFKYRKELATIKDFYPNWSDDGQTPSCATIFMSDSHHNFRSQIPAR
jgi:hypothetical protein